MADKANLEDMQIKRYFHWEGNMTKYQLAKFFGEYPSIANGIVLKFEFKDNLDTEEKGEIITNIYDYDEVILCRNHSTEKVLETLFGETMFK